MDVFDNCEWSYCNANEAIGPSYRRNRTVPKIGVLLQHPYLFSRFSAVLRYLDRSEFDVLYIDCPQQEEIINWTKERNFTVRNLVSVIQDRERYKVVLSHNVWFAMDVDNGFVPSLIGQQHVRLMYSNGKEKEETIKRHNFIYDAILCYGPRHIALLKKNGVEAKIYAVGNPRLDRFFNRSFLHLKKDLNLSNEKKTILWLPTLDGQCNNIDQFLDIINRLSDQYNVIISLHKISAYRYVFDERLNKSKVCVLKNIDSVELMQICDFVFCDYGGSALSAIYLDKNIVLLDVDNIGNSRLMDVCGSDSSEFYIRKFFPHYSVRDEQRLIDDLKNEGMWEEQKIERDKLSREFYVDCKGYSGYNATKILKKYLDKQ